MHIRTPKDWELPESAVTPESLYQITKRRDFVKTLGVTPVALAGREALGATAGFPSRVNADYRDPALKPTGYEHITSYNNFYEFGTSKEEPKDLANRGWKTEPWTVEITGLVNQPMKIDVNDLVGKMTFLRDCRNVPTYQRCRSFFGSAQKSVKRLGQKKTRH
jgi:sulfoxide reductase catalytic subunit YedY